MIEELITATRHRMMRVATPRKGRTRAAKLFTAPLALVLGTALMANAPVAVAIDVGAHPPLQALYSTLVNEHGFDPDNLDAIFASAVYKPKIISSMKRPAERLTWKKYRPLFVTEQGAKRGVAFINKHADAFARAEEKYGVPTEVIAAFIGVETRYGKVTGSHRILDSLTTLTVGYPRRSKFFGRELKEFLLLSREEGFDPLSLKGSYAGAMGIPQFISSSYRAYAIDFSGDGVRDLLTSPADAIGSIGNYLKTHGWRRGELIAVPATVNAGVDGKSLAVKGRKPDLKRRSLESAGVKLAYASDDNPPVGLVRLNGASGIEYRGAFTNFFKIMTYNPSKLYAMAVFELSEEIKRFR